MNGVATFSDLSITTAGSYRLDASDGHLRQGDSSTFNISAAAATQIVFTTEPSNGTTSNPLRSVKVSVEDQYGNVVKTDTSAITLAIDTGPTGATLGGTLAVAVVNGVAVFNGLTLADTGTYTLDASDGSLTGATSDSFVISTPVTPPPHGHFPWWF